MGHFVAGEEMGHFVAGTICRMGRKWDILSSGIICRLKNAGGTICRWDKMSPNRLSPPICAQIRVLVSSCVTDDCSSYGLFALGELEAGRNELRDLIWRDLIGRGLDLDQNLIEKSLQERD